MQAAHSTKNPVAFPFDPVLVELPLLSIPAAVVWVLVVAIFATDGAFDPPQPATSNASPATAPTNKEQRTLERNIG
jgi:hypothetical protein